MRQREIASGRAIPESAAKDDAASRSEASHAAAVKAFPIERKASFLVRKMEPYGDGDGRGAHSTLVTDTEVALAFLGGDPDPSAILGTAGNAEINDAVAGENRNVAHRTVSPSGIIRQICDGVV